MTAPNMECRYRLELLNGDLGEWSPQWTYSTNDRAEAEETADLMMSPDHATEDGIMLDGCRVVDGKTGEAVYYGKPQLH